MYMPSFKSICHSTAEILRGKLRPPIILELKNSPVQLGLMYLMHCTTLIFTFFCSQRPLITDPKDTDRFRSVLVDPMAIYRLEQGSLKKSAAMDYLLNGVIDLVFDTNVLAKSCGLGLRNSKKEVGRAPLPQLPVAAIKGEYCKFLIQTLL